jgi:hypothetical protein
MRCRGMAKDKLQTQLKQALSDRDTRVAVLISEAIRNALDLLDEQSPTVIEAMIAVAKEVEPQRPKHRAGVRQAIIEYAEEYCLKEARARERRLFQGITGVQ